MTAIALEPGSTIARSPSRVDWKNYAACYDLLAAMNPAYVELLEEFRAFCHNVNLREGMRILDLGGGTGNFFCRGLPEELRERCELIHLDSDAEMISIAREKYRQHGLNVQLIHGDASKTIFPAGHLDCVVSDSRAIRHAGANSNSQEHSTLAPTGCFSLPSGPRSDS